MKTVEFEGTQHQFPDDFSDQDIAKALGSKGQPQENAITTGFREAVEPLTRITKAAIGNMPNALGFLSQVAQRYGSPQVQKADEAIRQAGAEATIPQTPTDLALTAGTLGAGRYVAPLARAVPYVGKVLAPASRIAGAVAGQEAGNLLEGRPLGTGETNPLGPTSLTVGAEALGPLGRGFGRVMPGAKARINANQARQFEDVIGTVSPELGQAVQDAKATVRPGTVGRTQAAMQEAALGGSAQQNMSDRMERMVQNVERAAPSLAIDTPALHSGYSTLPALEQQRIGAPGPNGFSLRQAQAIRSYIGSSAFSQSPLGQGVTPVAKQDLWGRIGSDMDAAIGRATTGAPGMLTGWRVANRDYGGGQMLQEGLQRPSAFRGAPNEISLNRNDLSDWLSQNRLEGRSRMGTPQYEATVNALLEGGQPGTKDILAPGGGNALDALRQVYGRGQGGAPQILGSILRTATPNIGGQYTGQRPVPSAAQTILDLIAQRGAQGIPAPTGGQ